MNTATVEAIDLVAGDQLVTEAGAVTTVIRARPTEDGVQVVTETSELQVSNTTPMTIVWN
jgi:fructose-1,6-bisphosphatase/inositol monophosphatase family enzyme